MDLLPGRKPFDSQKAVRTSIPRPSKLIVLSCEGSVTEETYFQHVQHLFDRTGRRIRILTAKGDAVKTSKVSHGRGKTPIERDNAPAAPDSIDGVLRKAK